VKVLTKKYFTRVRAAMMLEYKGYMTAKRRYAAHLSKFTLEDLIEAETVFRSSSFYHGRGVARYIRELIEKRKRVVVA
jgi:hypothetical protein